MKQITVVSGSYSKMVFTLIDNDKVVDTYEIQGKMGWRAAWWVARSLGGAKWGDTAEVSILMEKRWAP